MTFTRNSSSDYVIRKLDLLSHIYNDLLDCFDIINTNYVKQIICVLMAATACGVVGLYGIFRYYNINSTNFSCIFHIPDKRKKNKHLNLLSALMKYDYEIWMLTGSCLAFAGEFVLFGVLPSVFFSELASNEVKIIFFITIFKK